MAKKNFRTPQNNNIPCQPQRTWLPFLVAGTGGEAKAETTGSPEFDPYKLWQKSMVFTSINGQHPWSTHLVPCLEVFGFIVLVQVAFRFWTQSYMSNSMECSMQRRTRGYRWFKCSDCIFPPDSLDCPWYIDSIHEIDARFYHAHSDKYVYVSIRIQLYTTVYN